MSYEPKVYHPTAWEAFKLTLENDAVQLGMDLTTYYALCCVGGIINATIYASAWGWTIDWTRLFH